MTIPSRPAPAPPGSRAQNAAVGANASLEQLRQQLQQQQMQQQQQQQQGNNLQRLTIKLPPPPTKGTQNVYPLPKRPTQSNYNNNNNNNGSNGGFTTDNTTLTSTSSITRKFPQARYTPTTNWDDSPFDPLATPTLNGNQFKKMPPPRPPPPKVQVNGRKITAPPPPPTTTTTNNTQTGNLLTSIFHRNKKSGTTTSLSSAAANKAAAQNRIYGLSSGNGTTAMAATATATTTTTTTNGYGSYGASNNTTTSANYNWNAAWDNNTTTNNTNNKYAFTSAAFGNNGHITGAQDAQLISFDSPPSSPTFTQKSNSDCVSVDSFSSDSNFSSPNNGSVSQPESGFEDDFHAAARSRPATTSPLDPWETVDAFGAPIVETIYGTSIGTAPVRNIALTKPANNHDNPLCNGKSLLPPAQSLTAPTIIKPKIAQKPKAPKPPMLTKPMDYVLDTADHAAITPPSPPMPKGAPPPPPPTIGGSAATSGISLIDVISGKVDALALSAGSSGYIEEIRTPYAIALFNFDGVEEGDLTFRENEKIYLIEQVSETWYRGRTRAGCEGIFPENYVDIKVPLNNVDNAAQHATAAAQHTFNQQKSTATAALPTARCLYDFHGEFEGDLALKENDLVTVHYRINEDWLYGEIAGRQGQFPANFLEHVPAHLPMP